MTQPAGSETHVFQAEVQQLLHLMIHSLYSNREIFLRELISNASDACDKLRFEALTEPALLAEDSELQIRVACDSEAGTVTVSDNGIGMSREEVVANIGTIARSGTREFLASLSGDAASDARMIGQFGVGFYSAFVVAERVTVTTRRAGGEEAVRWESTGEGEYSLQSSDRQERGTEVVLHLREDATEFAEASRLRTIIARYSDHIPLPVLMPAPPGAEDKTDDKDGDDAAATVDNQVVEWETVNRAAALWSRPRNEISDEEYREFYKHVAHDFEDPLSWSHRRVEGRVEYTSLLFLPARAPWDLWQADQSRGVKLYVQRVFIMDDAEQFLPRYLRFVRGVLDSSDLPLNVSRELLQSSRVADRIRSGCIKQVLDLLERLAEEEPETYAQFWKEFGTVLKEGVGEDHANRDRLAKLLRFPSTAGKDDEQVSLADYISRLPEGRKHIYYVTADSLQAARSSPSLEVFLEREIEVLLLCDRVDEWVVAHLNEFEGHSLRSVNRGELDLNELEQEADKDADDADKDKANPEFDAMLTRVRTALEGRIEDVRLSRRLRSSAACIVAAEGGMSAHLERMLREAGQNIPSSLPILELNPEHPIVLRARDEADEARFADWATLLLEEATLAEGVRLDDPAAFVRRINDIIVALAE